jgi:hypothetical protein
MLGTFMFAEFVGTQLRLLRLVLDGLFAVDSLWSLLRTTSKQFLYFLSIFCLQFSRFGWFYVAEG